MNTAVTHPLRKLLLVGVASATLALGASAAVSASTGTTEPADDMTEHTDATHTMDSAAPASLAVDGSADASSPEAEAFCSAELALEAAFASEDPAIIGPAVEALTAAAPADMAETVGAVLATAESGPGDPAFEEAYGALIEYMQANCGFAQLDLAASDFAFGGFPAEMPAGPVIVGMENIGEEVHEVVIWRINDDVTLTPQEMLELPEEELFVNAVPQAFAFAYPGATGRTVTELTPGNYFAVCFLQEGSTPEIIDQMGVGPEVTVPEGIELGPPHFALGMIHEFTVA